MAPEVSRTTGHHRAPREKAKSCHPFRLRLRRGPAPDGQRQEEGGARKSGRGGAHPQPRARRRRGRRLPPETRSRCARGAASIPGRFLGTGLPYPPESHEEAQKSAFITGHKHRVEILKMQPGGERLSSAEQSGLQEEATLECWMKKSWCPGQKGRGLCSRTPPPHSKAQEEAPPEGLSIWLPHPHPQQDKAPGGSPVPLCSQFGPHPEPPSTHPPEGV
ncbi:uncharacterized protein LOC123000765 [Ursus arctos]|uniref:uncharacterized protein LOC123000765 n=1 Tax=Ursus arctos TaxID=9644 RepID=UPI0025498893|nr:uncharacterized protein LOC123000765 [Ursus arctos]